MLALALLAGLAAARADGEALVALDVKNGTATDIVQALAEVAGLQAVLDPDVACRLTLKLNAVSFTLAFESVLRACGLGYEGEGNVLRVATIAHLRQEAADRRRLAEARSSSRPRGEVRLRLSYARAAEMAPKVKRFLSPRGEVAYDERTNTLILMDAGPP